MSEDPPRVSRLRQNERDLARANELLGDFDFDIKVVEDLLSDRIRKSGVSSDEDGLATLKIETTQDSNGPLARSNLSGGVLRLDIRQIEFRIALCRQVADAQSEWTQEQRESFVYDAMHYQLVEAVVHEYVHLRTGASEHVSDDGNSMRVQAGLGAHILRIGQEPEKIHEGLNEAVTEKIAREVYAEYSRRVGQSGSARNGLYYSKKLPEYFEQDIGSSIGYVKSVSTLDLLIDHVAKELNLPSEVIWGGIQQAYFSHSQQVEDFMTQVSEFLAQEFPNMISQESETGLWDTTLFAERLTDWEKKRDLTLGETFNGIE